MKVFISGGCKNGKSLYAQKIAKSLQQNSKPLYYLATMIPTDIEDENRIKRHQEERDGWGFETVLTANNICLTTSECDNKGVFLLDSVTALLANEMFAQDGTVIHDAQKKVCSELKAFLSNVSNIVLVSDYIFSDSILYDELTECYRAGLAYIDKEMAKICDVVIEAYYGCFIFYKGKELFGDISYETY